MIGTTPQTLADVIHIITDVITGGMPYGILLLIFYWNIYQIIATSGNAEKRKQAVPRLIWSIIVLAIVFSLAGLINLLVNTVLGTSLPSNAPASTASPSAPSFTGQYSPYVTPTSQVDLTPAPRLAPVNNTLPNATINTQ